MAENDSWVSGVSGGGGQEPLRGGAAPCIEGYEILGRIGQGGMGTVWRARQLATRREVALKLMSEARIGSEKEIRRFEREVELAATLEHPCIARVYDSGVHRGVYFYAMEFIDGKRLDQYVAEKKLSQRDILRLMLKVCEAVQHAHQHAIIHRDLKPSNILVTADGVPHVLDFGLAKLAGGGDPIVSMSMDGELVGTPIYMSPEQAIGTVKNLNTGTDVYSLGVLLYELILGVYPHGKEGGHLEILRRAREEEPVRPRSVSRTIDRDLEALMLKALAKRPEERYGTAGELAADIERYLAGNPLVAKPPTAAYLLSKTIQKHRMPITGAFIILVILAGTGAYSFNRVRRSRDLAREESLRARRASARAEARFAIQDKRLTDALAKASEAYELGGGQWEDGLLLNEIYNESRARWSLFRRYPPVEPTAKACFARCEGVDYLVTISDADMKAYALDDGGVVFTNQLPEQGRAIMKYDAASTSLVVGVDAVVYVYSIPDLKLLSERQYPARIRRMATGGGYVLLVHQGGEIRVVGLPLLEDKAVESWDSLAGGAD